MTNEKLRLSVSPHIHSGSSTRRIMADVLIALLPTAIAGTVIFGLWSVLVLAVCTATAVGCEALYCCLMKKEQTVGDLSAAITGLLLGLNLPVNTPLWQAAIGSVFAVLIVKCLFGGLGKNVVNPAIAARVFMLVSFGELAKTTTPALPDVIAGATPLVQIAGGSRLSLLDLLLGLHGGAIGEVCAVALLAGGVYLLCHRVITWHAPVAFIGGVFLFSFLFGGFDAYAALSLVLSGGLLLGAFFMATDYVTTPTTGAGRLVFGLGCALITVMIRFFGNYPEGVSFAILFMNILTPYIDAWTPRRLFGGKSV